MLAAFATVGKPFVLLFQTAFGALLFIQRRGNLFYERPASEILEMIFPSPSSR